MKNMKKLTCQVLAACALTTGMMLVNGETAYAETSSGHTVTFDDNEGAIGEHTKPVYGGEVNISTGEGEADNNTVNITTTDDSDKFTASIAGGFVNIGKQSTTNVAIANGNAVNITATATAGTFQGAISGGYDDTKGGMAQADNNIVKIDSGKFISQSNCDIAGGWARSIEGPSCVAQANGNKVVVKNINISVKGWTDEDGFLNRNIYGGYATSNTGGTAIANNNSLTISGASTSIELMPHASYGDRGFSESVIYAGCAINGSTNTANNNTLIIDIGTTGKIDGYNDGGHGVKTGGTEIGGGFASNGTATGNKVIIHSGTIGSTDKEINVYGGKARTLAKGNEVIIDGDATVTGNVSGGYGEGDNPTVEGNRVVFSAGNVKGMVSGGSGIGATIKGNEVIISGGTPTATKGIYGAWGKGQFTNAEGNKVVVTDGATVIGDVHGGYVDEEHNSAAKNNAVVIADGTVEGNVFGGGTWWADYMAGSAQNVVNNTVVLGAADGSGTAHVTKNVYINWHNFDDTVANAEALPGGNLNVHNVGNTVTGDVNAPGGNINFYIKDGENDTTTARLKAAKAYLDNANVKVNVPQQLGVLDNGTSYNLFGGTEIIAENGAPTYTITDDFIDSKTSLVDGKVALNHANDTANENSKSPVETQIVGVALVNGVIDMMANQGFSEAAEAINNSGDGGRSMSPYATVGGSVMRQNSGSYVEMNTWNIGVGFAKEVANSRGKLMFGPVFEYGKGSYDSYLDNGTHGSGDSSFWGVGAMIKQENKDGLYYEGSLRAGRLKNDYESRLSGGASYDNSAAFYALHAGVGKVVKLNEDDTLDYYGKLFYTHQNGSSATLTSGHIYDFDAINSFRTHLGLRYTHKMNKNQDVYAGLAWQHEFGSTANATFHSGPYSFSAPAPSVKGETGIIELGMKVKRSNGKFESDFGFIGSIGKQRGMGFNAKIQWNF